MGAFREGMLNLGYVEGPQSAHRDSAHKQW